MSRRRSWGRALAVMTSADWWLLVLFHLPVCVVHRVRNKKAELPQRWPRVKIDEKLLWRAYRYSPTLFRTVPSSTPYGLPFPKIGGSQPQPKTAVAILLSQERVMLLTADLADTFTGSIRTRAHEKFRRKGSVGVSRDCPIFWVPPIISRMSRATNFKFCTHVGSIRTKAR